MALAAPALSPGAGFRHEALLYAGDDGFLEATVPFLRDALERDEPALVMVGGSKIGGLRAALDGDAGRVLFADMAEVGANPARIIPFWERFLADHSGGGVPLRGVAEPVWAGRSPAELVECQRHESLLNVAFSRAPAWWLVCPYDVSTLAPAVLEDARRSHPFLRQGDASQPSASYRGPEEATGPFDSPLPDPPASAPEVAFGSETSLGRMRGFVSGWAAASGMGEARAEDLVLAVNEVATNSLCYGGGHGVLRVWREDSSVICEVRDGGLLTDPLAGRVRPDTDALGGRGLWLANQICDLVQVRSFPDGLAVRLHMAVPDRSPS